MPAAKLEQNVANAIRTELLSPEAVEFVVSEVRRGSASSRFKLRAPLLQLADAPIWVEVR